MGKEKKRILKATVFKQDILKNKVFFLKKKDILYIRTYVHTYVYIQYIILLLKKKKVF